MNKIKQSITIAGILCLLLISPFSFGIEAPSLIGSWQAQGPEGKVSLVFKSEKLLIFDGEAAQYIRLDKVLRVTDDDGIMDYPYAFQDGKLIIVFPGGYQMIFEKVGGATGAPGQAGKAPQANPGMSGVDSATLAAQISGLWWGYTGNTERKIGLCPNGVYQDYRESSYSGNSPDMSWGSASQGGGSGTWTIQGDYQQGVISVQYNNGSKTSIRYSQCGERGCLLFNGNKLCRNGRCK